MQPGKRIRGNRIALAVVLLVGLAGCPLLCEKFLEVQDLARRASCRPVLILGEALDYAKKHDGLFPPLSSVPGRLTFDAKAKAYTYSVQDHVCEFDREGPSEGELSEITDPAVIDDWSYAYLGYFIENEEQAETLAQVYKKTVSEGGNFEGDLKVPPGKGNCGGDTLFRLRTPESLPPEAACLREKAARIPVVIEWPGNHRRMGGHVLFLTADRQVYIPYPGGLPMTQRFLDALHRMDNLGSSPKNRP